MYMDHPGLKNSEKMTIIQENKNEDAKGLMKIYNSLSCLGSTMDSNYLLFATEGNIDNESLILDLMDLDEI